jgi:NhaA family Na+:H+ antiporter
MTKIFKQRFFEPIFAFIHDSRAVGITLLVCTFLSLLLSNLSFTQTFYANLWKYHFNGTTDHHLTIGLLSLPNSILLIINDFLMAFFFFLAGMEIKRELLVGELSSFQKSLLPISAAIGGMIVPAILYMQFNRGTENSTGWAIPMATDIAFSLGVLSLLGKKIPVSLKIFLTALAIIDDLGAIIVIALFYGGHLQLAYLLAAGILMIVLYYLNTQKKPFGYIYVIVGGLLWYCMFNSGIHATVAGVLFAFFIPLENLKKLELQLHTPVYFVVIPIFALANTAIIFPENSMNALTGTISIGILIGLCIGKPLGICGIMYYVVKRKWASLPLNIGWHQIIGVGMLAGIGFTMSIFISSLAFTADPIKDDISKISVLLASFLSMLIGYLWLNKYSKGSLVTTTAKE